MQPDNSAITTGMAKAAHGAMNYYEKLVKRIDRSMASHPHSVMAMNMHSFAIVAKARDFKSLSQKLHDNKSSSTVVFQKPSPKEVWIL